MKPAFRTILVCLMAILPASLHAQSTVITQGEPQEVEITASELADRIVEYAETFLGTPYRYAANGPRHFDCTGYTRYVFGHFGYDNLSRSSKDQARDGREVDISDFHNLQKGDILILGSRRHPKVVGHVGIFTGLDSTGRDPRFIHASNHGVRYSTLLTETYYSNRLLGARRILPDFRQPYPRGRRPQDSTLREREMGLCGRRRFAGGSRAGQQDSAQRRRQLGSPPRSEGLRPDGLS